MDSRYSLRLQAAQGVGASAQRAVLDFTNRHGLTLEDFFSLPYNDWKNSGLNDQQAATLAAAKTISAAERWANELAHHDIHIINLHDSAYPERLKRVLGGAAPPILAIWGNLRLLDVPAVGWCGSRHASEQGIGFTEDTVQQAVEHEIVVVSGAAKGIDTAAHRMALISDGSTIVVAPEGILNFRLRKEIKDAISPTNALIVSEFQPNARWSVANAMTRNHTLIGLSNALIVVESGLQGGTFEAGQFALKTKVPLFVAEYAQPSERAVGNAYFIQRGATPIRRNPHTQRASLQRLMENILTHYDDLKQPPAPLLVQGTLFTDQTLVEQSNAPTNG